LHPTGSSACICRYGDGESASGDICSAGIGTEAKERGLLKSSSSPL
ncbi:MAG: hypothetical protein ISR71_05430, partial [Gammaproteobacteria bacterium]|nr:hypothetical protein [Gammaproteobacteria bacterium]